MAKKYNIKKERKLECSIDEYCYGDINKGSQWTESYIDLSSKKYEDKDFDQEKFSNSSLELIEDLREKLRIYPEELALIFPNRVKKYTYKDLSLLWSESKYFIKNLKRRRDGYKIETELLDLLKKKLTIRFQENSNGCLKIIQQYYDNKITLNQFFDIIISELGKISEKIEVTDEEMGVILQGTKTYIHDKIFLIRHNYPYFKFSLERLNYMEKHLKLILGEKSKEFLDLIQKYKDLNPNLKIYPKQQYTIKNPKFFEEINSYEKSYWFGFLHADGWLNIKTYRIGLELSVKDKEQLITFTKILGLKKNRIKERTRIIKYKGKLKSFKMVYLKFVCKPMALDLYNHGFLDLKENSIGIPNFVKFTIQDAKNKQILSGSTTWKRNFEYKLALAWLLGFFDGDGTINEDTKLARIYSNNKILLEDIKNYFDIENYSVRTNHKGQKVEFIDVNSENSFIISKPQYSLQLDWKFFKYFTRIYKKGINRKRP
ncbi:MAG: hypothetical protein EU533_00135 [Promethearchaeota archaeon]|nr:MAG: hypothetical protein EU533_00135 [Candidatus Lokiarchaeota archaeon]